MKAVKGVYENGEIKLAERPTETGPIEVMVVFSEPAADPWEGILNDPRPRPMLNQWVQEVRAEIVQGVAEPLDLQRL